MMKEGYTTLALVSDNVKTIRNSEFESVLLGSSVVPPIIGTLKVTTHDIKNKNLIYIILNT